MDFGVGLLNYAGCWDDAAFAEEHGFASAGFVDSPLNNGDPFAAMVLTAQATDHMRLGTFLNIPSLRTAASTASALSTINAIAPGRVFYGTGTGDTGRGTFGIPAMSAQNVATYATQVRNLMTGEEVVHHHAGRHTQVRSANSDFVRNNLENPVPIYFAADGPKAFRATAEVADGWIATLAKQGSNTMASSPDFFARSLASIQKEAADLGGSFDDPYSIWTTAVCILEPGESAVSPRALARTGPMATFPFHAYGCHPEIGQFFPPVLAERLEIYENEVLAKLPVPRELFYQYVHAGHLSHLLDGEALVLTEEIVRMTTLTGTVEEVAGVLHELERLGLRNVSLWIPPAVFTEVVVEVETQLMPALAGASA